MLKISIITILLFITGCTSKQIKLINTTKISLENIKHKTFFDHDYSSGMVGGTLIGESSMASILQGYYLGAGVIIASTYTAYKILDYNDKPIALKHIDNNELYDYLRLINNNLKKGLQKNYISMNNLKFPKNKKDYYRNKIVNFTNILPPLSLFTFH